MAVAAGVRVSDRPTAWASGRWKPAAVLHLSATTARNPALLVGQRCRSCAGGSDAASADVALLRPALERALREQGYDVTRERAVGTFARITVTDGPQATVVDLASDFRLLPPVDTAFGTVVAAEELAADKFLALADRVEARDYRLVERYGLEQLCDLARRKDPGFQRRALADMLGQFDRLSRLDSRLTTPHTVRSARR